jgi:hypothetical protein
MRASVASMAFRSIVILVLPLSVRRPAASRPLPRTSGDGIFGSDQVWARLLRASIGQEPNEMNDTEWLIVAIVAGVLTAVGWVSREVWIYRRRRRRREQRQ